jgi:hypothetical protein
VWLLSYTFGAKALSGDEWVTGAIEGEYPKSWIKVALLVIVIVIV